MDRLCPGVENRLPRLADELKRQDQKVKCYLCSAKCFWQVYISVCVVEQIFNLPSPCVVNVCSPER